MDHERIDRKAPCSQKGTGFNGFPQLLLPISRSICSARVVGSTWGGGSGGGAARGTGYIQIKEEIGTVSENVTSGD